MPLEPRLTNVRTIYRFIKAHQREFPVEVQCKVLGVAVSGYYAWLRKPISNRGLEDARGASHDLEGDVFSGHLRSRGVIRIKLIASPLRLKIHLRSCAGAQTESRPIESAFRHHYHPPTPHQEFHDHSFGSSSIVRSPHVDPADCLRDRVRGRFQAGAGSRCRAPLVARGGGRSRLLRHRGPDAWKRDVFAETRGMADKAQALPNTLATRFNIASVGKFLTASVLSKVAADAGLELASIRPVETLKERSALFDDRLTAVDLLAHRTVVRSMIEVKGGIDRVLAARSNRDFADLVTEAQEGPIAPLRGELRYSNANSILLGEMAAKMGGKSYEDLLRAIVLDPAGATSAAFSRDSGPGQAAPALGYVAADFNEDEEAAGPAALAADYPRPYSKGLAGARASAAGGLFISAPDLAKVGVALLSGRVLPPSRLQELCTTQIPVIPMLIHGLGCSGVNHGPGVRRFGHNGGAPGVSAEFALYPDSGLSLAVLSNHDRRAQPVLKAFEASYFGDAARLRPGMILR